MAKAKAKVLVEDIQLGMTEAVIQGGVELELENKTVKKTVKKAVAKRKDLGRL